MIQKTRRAWFEVWGNEAAQNQILKGLLLVFGCVNTVLAISLTIVSFRSPPIFAVSSVDSGMLRSDPPPKEYLEREAKRVISHYLEIRHNWEPGSIEKSIGKASRFVDRSFRESFLRANASQIKIAQEKKVSQRFYISSVNADLEKGVANVAGDRILTIDGLRAVSSLAFALKIRIGDRTEQNPEGVYVTSEQLIDNGME